MISIKIALRNIFRNYRRSVLTMLSIIVGLVAIIIANGFVKYSMWGLRESTIRGGIGHFQIYQKGYSAHKDSDAFDYLITNEKAVIRKLFSIPGIDFVTPRVKIQGILAGADKSAIVLGYGGWNEEEKKLNAFSSLKKGKFSDKPYSIVVGEGLAKKLNIGIDDTVTLMSTMKGGGMNASDFTIRGIIKPQIKEYNDRLILGNLKDMQALMDINGAESLVVVLKHTRDTAKVLPKIRALCQKLGLEYKSWKSLAPFYFQVKGMYGLILSVMMIIILIVVVFAIANTMTMNVFERIREIGSIRAMGSTRGGVTRQFLTESLLISLIASVVGIVLGYGISALINISGGIPVPPPPGNAKGYTALIRPDFLNVLEYTAAFIGISIFAGLFPAYKASKMKIIDAIRWV